MYLPVCTLVSTVWRILNTNEIQRQLHNFGYYLVTDLYLDEEKNAYTTLNFGRFSMLGALGAAVDSDTRKINSEAKKVGITGNIKGDIKQLGGLLIVRKGMRKSFRSIYIYILLVFFCVCLHVCIH